MVWLHAPTGGRVWLRWLQISCIEVRFEPRLTLVLIGGWLQDTRECTLFGRSVIVKFSATEG